MNQLKCKTMCNYSSAICEILKQISDVLFKESGQKVDLRYTGNKCPDGNGKISIEIVEVDIPENLISQPNPNFPNDKSGYYKVNRIRLGNIILDDTSRGFPFSEKEIETVIKGAGVWAYY